MEEASGWTIEQVQAQQRVSEVLDGIVHQIVAERPGIYVGGALSPEPGGAPTIYIKGPADEFVRGLVAGAEIEIKLVDNQPFSQEEITPLQMQIFQALEEKGFRPISAGYDLASGEVEVTVAAQAGQTDDPAEVLLSLPGDLRDFVTITVWVPPVTVVDPEGLGPLAVLDSPGGSAWLALGGTGPIRIGERCVTLPRGNGDSVLLVWRSGEVLWDEKDREITFISSTAPDEGPITIRDGDIITVGGGWYGDPEDMAWVAPPDESCGTEDYFQVHSVDKEP